MTPNCPEPYTPTVADSKALVARIGKSQTWIADRIGISRRHLQYILKGEREDKGKIYQVRLTYPEQFALECLAAAAETFNSK